MVRAIGEVVIARPPSQVFALLDDPSRIPSWRADVLDATALEGTGVGARYRETIAFMGRKTQTFEVVERDPSRRLAVRAVDGLSLRPLQVYSLVAEGDGTRVRYEIDLPVTGWFLPMTPMLAWMIPQKWRGYAVALKTAVEASG